MRYKGPIYRPPSEAGSLLIQATAGCPHNKCTFCLVYKKGPRFKVRPVSEVIEDLESARQQLGQGVLTLFFPAGNSIAVPTDQLLEMCRAAREKFPRLERITVYGSARYILEKGDEDLQRLAAAGLSRIHVGLESGSDEVLKKIKKGADRQEQIAAGQMLRRAGIENSTYVMLGIGGRALSREHARDTASAVNMIHPDFVRVRTFLPKANTPLLRQIEKGAFDVVSPHEALIELRYLLENITLETRLTSDHYTNYVNAEGDLPRDRARLLEMVDQALARDENCFREVYVGRE
ncbi:MAG: radical SAM protein [Desulfohalobiaceae bacterium]|nr:radical SAM protein [Desulfohalobiaceae bacterium]